MAGRHMDGRSLELRAACAKGKGKGKDDDAIAQLGFILAIIIHGSEWYLVISRPGGAGVRLHTKLRLGSTNSAPSVYAIVFILRMLPR